MAEILTGDFASPVHTAPSNAPPLRFPIDAAVIERLIQFCGGVSTMRLIQQRIRTAGKGVPFLAHAVTLPSPNPNPSQRAALDRVDRPGMIPFLRAGTLLTSIQGAPEDTFLFACRMYDGVTDVPRSLVNDPRIGGLPDLHVSLDTAEVPIRFVAPLLDVDQLRKFSPQHLDPLARNDAADLIMLLRLARLMLYDREQTYLLSQVAAQSGYVVESRDSFVRRFEKEFPRLETEVQQLLPHASRHVSADGLLMCLEALGATWPILHGPVVRRIDGDILIDVYAASQRLEERLKFGATTGDVGNERGDHFEEQVRLLIDTTPWGQLSADLRKLRGKTKIKGPDGKPLTNFDALAVDGDTLLVVECKSRWTPDAVFLGSYQDARNRAITVEKDARKARRISEFLSLHKVSPWGQYDFAKFERIATVVCTPVPIYVELGLVRSGSDPELAEGELESIVEVLPGLPRVLSLTELLHWFNHGTTVPERG